MNGWWMDGWMDEWMNDEWMDGWMNEWMMNGWMDGWMDEWVDRQMDELMNGIIIEAVCFVILGER